MAVLIMSEEMKEKNIFYALEEGADGYIAKPFSEKNLMKVINRVLESIMNPDPTKYQLQKLKALRLQKKYEDAIQIAEQILKQKMDVEVLVALGECYLDNKSYQDAKETFNRALEIKETYKALHLLGKVYFEEDKYEESINFFEKAYMINPMCHDAVIDMGRAYLRLGSTKEASEVFGSLQEQENRMTDSDYVNIGSAYLGSGDIDTTGEYLQKAKEPILETINVFNMYSIELKKAGRFQEAVDQYEKCLRIDPTNHIILFNSALLLAEMKRYSEAEKTVKKCLNLDPNYTDAKKLLDYVRIKLPKEA